MLLLDPKTRIIDLTVAELSALIEQTVIRTSKQVGQQLGTDQRNLSLEEAADQLGYKASYLRSLAKKAYDFNPKLFPKRVHSGDSYIAPYSIWEQVVKTAKKL